MTFTPPSRTIPADRRNPVINLAADIPALLDWLRGYYPNHTAIGISVYAKDTGLTYLVSAESAYVPFVQAGPFGTYTLTAATTGEIILPDIAALSAYSGTALTATVQDTVRGGTFTLKTAAQAGVADGGVRIAHSNATYVWVRQYHGRVMLRWYPPAADNSSALTAALLAAQQGGNDVHINAGVWIVHHVELLSRVKIWGDGMDNTILAAREDATYYNLGANVTMTDLDPSFNTTGAGVFGLTLKGRSAFANETGQHHLLWLNGVTDFSADNLRLNGPRGDGIFVATGNSATAKKRNFNVRLGYIHALGGGPITYHDTTTNTDTSTFDSAKWAAGTLINTVGGNRNPISVIECEGFSLNYCKAEDFGFPIEPGGLDFEPNNAVAAGSHLSVRDATVGIIEVIRGRGNFAALSWVSYVPNSALDRPMRGLTVNEIRMVDSPTMNALNVNGSETARSVAAQHNIEVKKFTVDNIANVGSIDGVYAVILRGIKTGTGPIKGALVFGSNKPVGDIVLADSVLPATTVNLDCLKLGQVDTIKTFNVTLLPTGAAITLIANKTSTGLDLSGVTVGGTGSAAVVTETAHTQTPATNYAPARGFVGKSSVLALPPIAPVLPRSSQADTVDLNGAAAYLGTYPAGHSSFSFNGGTNSPGPTQGEVLTYVEPAYGADGIGFAVQWFHARGPAGGSWVRYPASGAAGAAWSDWQQLMVGLTKVVSPVFGAIAGGAQGFADVVMAGNVVGDSIICSPNGVLETGLIPMAAVVIGGQVRLTLFNATSASITPANRTWKATVTRPSGF